jgi:hypothetical protein
LRTSDGRRGRSRFRLWPPRKLAGPRSEEVGFAPDSPVEGNGFELPVPRALRLLVPRLRFGPPSVNVGRQQPQIIGRRRVAAEAGDYRLKPLLHCSRNRRFKSIPLQRGVSCERHFRGAFHRRTEGWNPVSSTLLRSGCGKRAIWSTELRDSARLGDAGWRASRCLGVRAARDDRRGR